MAEKWKNNHFVVEVDGIQSPKIDEVQGLSFGEVGTVTEIDAGTNVVDNISSGIVRFEPLILIKNADGSQSDQDWINWFKETFDYNDIAGSQGSKARRNGAIIKKEYNVEVARFAFVGAWIKSLKMSDLAGMNEDLAKWTITLEVQGLYPELL